MRLDTSDALLQRLAEFQKARHPCAEPTLKYNASFRRAKHPSTPFLYLLRLEILRYDIAIEIGEVLLSLKCFFHSSEIKN